MCFEMLGGVVADVDCSSSVVGVLVGGGAANAEGGVASCGRLARNSPFIRWALGYPL